MGKGKVKTKKERKQREEGKLVERGRAEYKKELVINLEKVEMRLSRTLAKTRGSLREG